MPPLDHPRFASLRPFADRLIPLCRPDGEGCTCPTHKHEANHRGKVPLFKKWQSNGDFTWPKRYNVGIRLGDRLCVLDVDPRHGGDKLLAQLEKQHGKLPITPVVITGSPGFHYYFKCNENQDAWRLKDGLELKAGGGQVVAPGSLHFSGRHYDWQSDRTWAVGLATLPDWLVVKPKLEEPNLKLLEPIDPRDEAWTHELLKWKGEEFDLDEVEERCRLYLNTMPDAISGQHGHDLTWATINVIVRGFLLPQAAAWKVFSDWNAKKAKPPWSNDELKHKMEDCIHASELPWGFLLRGDRDIYSEEEFARIKMAEIAPGLRFVKVAPQEAYWDAFYKNALKPGGLNMELETNLNLGELKMFRILHGKRKLVNAKSGASYVNDRCPRADDFIWYPGKPLVFEYKGRTVVNTFVAPKEITAEPKCDPWLRHTEYLFPDEKLREHLFSVMAFGVQHLDEKVNHAVVLGGAGGIGKDTWLAPFARWVPHCFENIKLTDLADNWGYHLSRTKFLVIQESMALGTKSVEIYNKTKDLMASPPDELTVKEKFTRPYHIPNVVQVIITTNYKNGVYFDDVDDRRYFVAWSDATKKSAIYYIKLWQWLELNWQSVIAWLMARDLSRFDPKAPPPMTEGKKMLFEETRELPEQILSKLTENLPGFTREWLESKVNGEEDTTDADNCHDLLSNKRAFGTWARRSGFDVKDQVVYNNKRSMFYYRRGLNWREAWLAFNELV